MTVADLAIVAALVFGWGALSARLERFDVTEPLAAWYAKLLAHRAASGPGVLTPDMPDRRLIRRSPPPKGWHPGSRTAHTSRHFYWRQLRDM